VGIDAVMSNPAIEHPGSEAAFGQLVAEEGRALLRLARRLLGDEEEAKDLVQDALLRAHQALGGFRGESSLKSWVVRIVINQGLKKLRRRKLARSVTELFRPSESATPSGPATWGSHWDNPEKAASLREQARGLQVAMENLSPRQRTVFVLRYLEQMNVGEIAEVTGIGPGTVKTHLVRALRLIRSSGSLAAQEVQDESL
jgi:RNA polymerase sigma-70 factor, ECF subfamily